MHRNGFIKGKNLHFSLLFSEKTGVDKICLTVYIVNITDEQLSITVI